VNLAAPLLLAKGLFSSLRAFPGASGIITVGENSDGEDFVGAAYCASSLDYFAWVAPLLVSFVQTGCVYVRYLLGGLILARRDGPFVVLFERISTDEADDGRLHWGRCRRPRSTA
jgi:hypothetical protein